MSRQVRRDLAHRLELTHRRLNRAQRVPGTIWLSTGEGSQAEVAAILKAVGSGSSAPMMRRSFVNLESGGYSNSLRGRKLAGKAAL